MRAESFCSLEVLNGGLQISKLQFLIKNIKFFFSCKCFSVPDPVLDPDADPDWYSAKMLDLDPNSLNPDPKPSYVCQLMEAGGRM